MVCTRVLTGLLLFSLFSSGVSAAEVDLNTLPKIIKFIETKYKPSGQTDDGDGVQYAVAINVPAEQCQVPAKFDENTFLSGENKENVKNALNDKKVYQGDRVVASRPIRKIHSERELLMCGDPTPVQKLLNKDKNGCVVFYTYNSPCLDHCLNQAKEKVNKCIINSLSLLTNHSGPKALVFNRVYRMDKDKPLLASALKEVAKKVPLYKCNTNSCIKCLDNNVFNNQCLS